MKERGFLTIRGHNEAGVIAVLSADTPWERIRGLIRKTLKPDRALFIHGCWAIHTFFMQVPIDVLFVDREFRVLRGIIGLRPYRLAACRGAEGVLEFQGGRLADAGISPGTVLEFREKTEMP
ncbi:MAG: DUF192 domain-containing protein [Candidatus Omnitrophica bacterium]|nr:DUF192 domain-containing protein [Candidatus Omnitrophota bacterium]